MILAAPRHYSGYSCEEVLVHLGQSARQPLLFTDSKGRASELQFEGVFLLSRSVRVRFRDKTYQAVVLARSSDWYRYSLNCTERWHHRVTAAIVGTHDSCVQVPVFAVDEMRVYGPAKAILDDFTDETQFSDAFRKTEYGHCVLLGALLCKREDARARLAQLRPSTQYRIRAEVRRLQMRKRGRPLRVY